MEKSNNYVGMVSIKKEDLIEANVAKIRDYEKMQKSQSSNIKALECLNTLIEKSSLETLRIQGISKDSYNYNIGVVVEALVSSLLARYELKQNDSLSVNERESLMQRVKHYNEFNQDNTNQEKGDLTFKGKRYEIKSLVTNKPNAPTNDTPIYIVSCLVNVRGVFLISSENIRKYNLIGKRINGSDIKKAGKYLPNLSKALGF